MARHSSNVDPFNAGEPILPWDDAAAAHDDCRLDGDGGYEAPRRGEKPAGELGGVPVRSLGEKTPGPRPKMPTGKLVRPSSGADAAARTRRWVFVAIIVVIVFVTVGELVAALVYELYEPRTTPVETPVERVDDAEGERQITEVIEAELAALGGRESARSDVAHAFSDRIESWFGYTPEEMGLDVGDVAERVVLSLDCQVTSAYCFDGYDGDAPEGSVFVDGSVASLTRAIEGFSALADGYFDELGIAAYVGSDTLRDLTDGEKAHLAELFETAWDDAGDTAVSAAFEFDYEDGSWVLDRGDFDEEVHYLLVG